MSECYCCSCGYNEWGTLVRWDPACHNHGAFGRRGCKKHGVEPDLRDLQRVLAEQ